MQEFTHSSGASFGQMHPESYWMKQLFAARHPTQRKRQTLEQEKGLGSALGIMTQAVMTVTPAPLALTQTSHQVLRIQIVKVLAPLRVSARLGQRPLTSEL